MKFKINRVSDCEDLLSLCTILRKVIELKGNEEVAPEQNSNFVLNITDIEAPKAYRRKSQEEMVVSIVLLKESKPDIKAACYVALVKSISNILFCISNSEGKDRLKAYSITPEVGFVEFNYTPEEMYDRMYPVVSSHFVLRNRLYEDLRLDENAMVPQVEELKVFGKQLQKLGVLPAPFPLTEYLDKDLIDQLYRLYQIKGLSYGNLSIRNPNTDFKGTTYWMTARGVDKSNLKGQGKDILLVNGYDRETSEMMVSLPPHYDPRIRVSVDAIEHYLIYTKLPKVGAIVHLHAWIDGVICTDQSYPCGTVELAENVVRLLEQTSSPERTEVGLKNHGLTITGPDIRDIFRRITDRLKTNVPMMN